MTIDVTPCSDALGAFVFGADLSQPLDAGTIESLKAAWFEFLVLVFRKQTLTDKDLVRASNCFGACEKSPPNEAGTHGPGYVPLMPEVAVISNVVENGEPIGSLSNRELAWHTDMSYNEKPANASALYALELPARGGGETSYLNMYKAYETLPADLKAALKDKVAIHDSTYTSAGTLRKGFREIDDVREAPGARHPMLRTHPDTGRTALFLGRRTNSYIVGLPVTESEALLDRVWAHATQDAFVYTHVWQPGDLVLWDNRCVMHRREPFEATDRRIMHRTQLQGDAPYYSG